MKFKYLLFLSLFSVCLFAQKKNEIFYAANDYYFPYFLNKPETRVELPKILKEISGLSYYENNILVGIQDEKGIVFFIDVEKGEIINELSFNENGDYEGIEILDQEIWILKSNGKLIQLKNYLNNNKNEIYKHKTALRSENNCEGLGYDPAKNCLLIACKAYPYFIKKEDGKSKKAIYSYDLKTNELSNQPLFLIDLDSIKNHLGHNSLAKAGLKLLASFDSSTGDLTFQPSGIATHPLTGNYYILGSVGKLLIVTNPKGIIMAIVKLKKNYFPQAEGICFDPQGKLYISNEGKEKKASILSFKYLENK